jgi:hypothetical protein
MSSALKQAEEIVDILSPQERMRLLQYFAPKLSETAESKPALKSIDNELAKLAAGLAATHRSRGADAGYAAVATEFNCTLISLDNEHLSRLIGVLDMINPDTALTRLMNTLP